MLKSLANCNNPESCVSIGNGTDEALTGEGTGQVSSREIHEPLSDADLVEKWGRQHAAWRHRESCCNLARSKTLCMYRNTLFGNREVLSPTADGNANVDAVRTMNPMGARW